MSHARKGPETDAELVARARAGQPDAMDALVDRHHEAVYRMALAILGDGDRAADATQETFIRAHRALSDFRRESAFRTWLLAIARNRARSMLRADPRAVDRRRRPSSTARSGRASRSRGRATPVARWPAALTPAAIPPTLHMGRRSPPSP